MIVSFLTHARLFLCGLATVCRCKTSKSKTSVATLSRFSYISWYHKLKISQHRKQVNLTPGRQNSSRMIDRSFDVWLHWWPRRDLDYATYALRNLQLEFQQFPLSVITCTTMTSNHASKHFVQTFTFSTELAGLQHQASLQRRGEVGPTVATLSRFSYISRYHKLKISQHQKQVNLKPGRQKRFAYE